MSLYRTLRYSVTIHSGMKHYCDRDEYEELDECDGIASMLREVMSLPTEDPVDPVAFAEAVGLLVYSTDVDFGMGAIICRFDEPEIVFYRGLAADERAWRIMLSAVLFCLGARLPWLTPTIPADIAAALLMPRDAVLRAMKELGPDADLAAHFCCPRNVATLRLAQLELMSHRDAVAMLMKNS